MAASRSKSPVAVQALISRADGPLARLRDQAGELARLDRLLATLLPEPLSRHVRACAVHAGQLVLQVDAPAWSTRLRLEQQRLLEQLRGLPEQATLSSMRVTVAAAAQPAERAPRKPEISAAAAQALAQCAESQTDPALRASLTRLSRRV